MVHSWAYRILIASGISLSGSHSLCENLYISWWRAKRIICCVCLIPNCKCLYFHDSLLEKEDVNKWALGNWSVLLVLWFVRSSRTRPILVSNQVSTTKRSIKYWKTSKYQVAIFPTVVEFWRSYWSSLLDIFQGSGLQEATPFVFHLSSHHNMNRQRALSVPLDRIYSESLSLLRFFLLWTFFSISFSALLLLRIPIILLSPNTFLLFLHTNNFWKLTILLLPLFVRASMLWSSYCNIMISMLSLSSLFGEEFDKANWHF